METNLVERHAVATAAAPTVPLKALLDALAALERVAELPCDPLISSRLFLQVLQARNSLDAYLSPILRAQTVEVAA